jgi:phosphate acetyltransferase
MIVQGYSMGFHERVYEKAKNLYSHIVLPESCEARIQHAAIKVLEQGLVKRVSFVGNPDEIREISKQERIALTGVNMIDHLKEKNFGDFAEDYYLLRKHKGMKQHEAAECMKDPIYYGAMMVRKNLADGMVAGSVYSTASILRAALRVIGVRKEIKTASSCFVMILPDSSFGFEGQMIFADCATVPSPDSIQLAEIAISSAETGMTLLGLQPVIAMLSYSTKGSAKSEFVDKVRLATEIVREKRPDLVVDGELQADAALVDDVVQRKCPGSPVGGKANVLIFPDLNAGNIAYKLVQRLAHADAYGPILQGFVKPVNDLSRGCYVDDIVNVIAITAVQAFS